MAQKKSIIEETPKPKKRYTRREIDDKEALLHRLNRVEGQIKGVRRLLTEESYTPEIITQVAATIGALNAFSLSLLEYHIKNDIVDDIKQDKKESIDELLITFKMLTKNK